MPSPAARVQEFLRQWAMMRDKADIIYGVLADPEQDETVDLTVSDLHILLANQRTPEQDAVLRSAVAEYRAGHRSDSTKAPAAGDPEYLRGEYTKALTAYYRAVRAYTRDTSQQAKEPAPDVRP